MNRVRFAGTACISILFAAGGAAGQGSNSHPGGFSLAASAGPAFPLDDFTLMARTGWQAAVRGDYQFHAPLAAYVGVRYAAFPLKSDSATDNLSMVAPEAGVVLRARSRSDITPFVRAGAFVPHFASAGESSGAGVGFTGAVGLEFAVGDRFTAAVSGDGDFCGNGLKPGQFGPVPPKPGWLGVTLQARYSLR